MNPATTVRGPKHVVTNGATPVLSPAEARKLLDTIDAGALVGLRDRALLSVMLYSFARVSAVLGMRRQDYFGQGSGGWLRLHEKGGKRHDVQAHHRTARRMVGYPGPRRQSAAAFAPIRPQAHHRPQPTSSPAAVSRRGLESSDSPPPLVAVGPTGDVPPGRRTPFDVRLRDRFNLSSPATTEDSRVQH